MRATTLYSILNMIAAPLESQMYTQHFQGNMQLETCAFL